MKTNIHEIIRVHDIVPLHWTGTPDCLQALGREMAKLRLMGTWKGTPPVTMRHKQSWPLLMRSLRDLQQAAVGDDAFEPPARKLMHELKLRIIGPLQTELDCPYTLPTIIINVIKTGTILS